MISFTFTEFLNLSQNIESFFNNTLNNCKHKEFLLIYFWLVDLLGRGKITLLVCVLRMEELFLLLLYTIFFLYAYRQTDLGESLYFHDHQEMFDLQKKKPQIPLMKMTSTNIITYRSLQYLIAPHFIFASFAHIVSMQI